MIGPQRAVSAAMIAASACGLVPVGARPSALNFSLSSEIGSAAATVLDNSCGIELKRTLAEAGRALPTIFITALEPGQVSAPLAALAPVAVLYNPFDKQDLLEAIGRARG